MKRCWPLEGIDSYRRGSKVTSWRLPKVRDGKKGWRAGAVFSREELEALISDSRVPHDRRVMYALASVGCLRHGEAAGLRWRDVVFGLEPLGRIVVLTSYDQGDTKTGAERWMGRPRAAQFFETSAVRAMDERAQRKSLYAAFEYLHQMQFVQIASGLHNRCVYDDPRYTDTGPLPASVLITDAAIRQWSVLSSRAAFERFADLLHLLERGERIPSSTSRLKKLRAFLFLPASRFVYFAPVVQLWWHGRRCTSNCRSSWRVFDAETFPEPRKTGQRASQSRTGPCERTPEHVAPSHRHPERLPVQLRRPEDALCDVNRLVIDPDAQDGERVLGQGLSLLRPALEAVRKSRPLQPGVRVRRLRRGNAAEKHQQGKTGDSVHEHLPAIQ